MPCLVKPWATQPPCASTSPVYYGGCAIRAWVGITHGSIGDNAMMSKKHYVAIAACVAHTSTAPNTRRLGPVESLAYRLADYFASENPNFDRARFLKACGLEG